MSAVRFGVTFADGEVIADELVPLDVDQVELVAKDFWLLGRRGTISIEFDPPLLVAPAVDEAPAIQGIAIGQPIVRPTRGGVLELHDVAVESTCSACGRGDPIGIHAKGETREHTDGVCADCLAEALAFLFARRHVDGGGSLDDLRPGADREQDGEDGTARR